MIAPGRRPARTRPAAFPAPPHIPGREQEQHDQSRRPERPVPHERTADLGVFIDQWHEPPRSVGLDDVPKDSRTGCRNGNTGIARPVPFLREIAPCTRCERHEKADKRTHLLDTAFAAAWLQRSWRPPFSRPLKHKGLERRETAASLATCAYSARRGGQRRR